MQNIRPSALKPILISTIQKMGNYWRTSLLFRGLYMLFGYYIWYTSRWHRKSERHKYCAKIWKKVYLRQITSACFKIQNKYIALSNYYCFRSNFILLHFFPFLRALWIGDMINVDKKPIGNQMSELWLGVRFN